MSRSMQMQMSIATTPCSKIPRNKEAVNQVTSPTAIHGPKNDLTSFESFVILFIMKRSEKIFPTVIAILPNQIKTLAIN